MASPTSATVLILQEAEWTPVQSAHEGGEEEISTLRYPRSNPVHPVSNQEPRRLSYLAHPENTLKIQQINL